jgi:hypothetical protein
MTRRLPAVLLAFALSMPLVGCRTVHLGKDTTKAYDNAMQLQRKGASDEDGPALSAADAHGVLRAHRGVKRTGSSASSAPTLLLAPPVLNSGPARGGGGQWPGASGNINLEAK